ncbi:MAG TPA: hypothetical protein VGB60_10375 [Brevundimonas sp.]|uniref:DUF6894 family protein n=1 Tax=Brevundimonas sp. TaxID=1871086 RepID=UPI002ED83D91
MPRYHFHAADGSHYRDEEGEDLPGIAEARSVALDVLTEILPSRADEFWREGVFTVSVKDGTGRLVAVLTTTATFDPGTSPQEPPKP